MRREETISRLVTGLHYGHPCSTLLELPPSDANGTPTPNTGARQASAEATTWHPQRETRWSVLPRDLALRAVQGPGLEPNERFSKPLEITFPDV